MATQWHPQFPHLLQLLRAWALFRVAAAGILDSIGSSWPLSRIVCDRTSLGRSPQRRSWRSRGWWWTNRPYGSFTAPGGSFFLPPPAPRLLRRPKHGHRSPASPPTPPTETLEARLRRLEATWLAEVGFSSSSSELRQHPAFQEIIDMGEAVVRFSCGTWKNARGSGSGHCPG